MGTSSHRRRASGRTKIIGAVVAAAVIGGAAFALTGTAQAAAVGAAYTRTSTWTGGYTGQYVVTNQTSSVQSGAGRWSSTCRPARRSAPCGTVSTPSRGSTSP